MDSPSASPGDFAGVDSWGGSGPLSAAALRDPNVSMASTTRSTLDDDRMVGQLSKLRAAAKEVFPWIGASRAGEFRTKLVEN